MKISFNKKDFVQFGFYFLFRNETSSIEYTNIKEIVAQEIASSGISLRVPSLYCQQGHTLLLMLVEKHSKTIPLKLPADGRGKGISFSAVAKVTGKIVDETDHEYSFIQLRFTQYDKHSWDDILKKYEENQASLYNTVQSIRVNE